MLVRGDILNSRLSGLMMDNRSPASVNTFGMDIVQIFLAVALSVVACWCVCLRIDLLAGEALG